MNNCLSIFATLFFGSKLCYYTSKSLQSFTKYPPPSKMHASVNLCQYSYNKDRRCFQFCYFFLGGGEEGPSKTDVICAEGKTNSFSLIFQNILMVTKAKSVCTGFKQCLLCLSTCLFLKTFTNCFLLQIHHLFISLRKSLWKSAQVLLCQEETLQDTWVTYYESNGITKMK